MRSGEHWTGYPPDDPPEPERWCSEHGRAMDEGEDCPECAAFAEIMQGIEYDAQHQLTYRGWANGVDAWASMEQAYEWRWGPDWDEQRAAGDRQDAADFQRELQEGR